MEVSKVADILAQRRLERIEAKAAEQDGLIEYMACMADIELPETERESAEVPEHE